MIKFQLKYFIATILLLLTEICIALYAHDNFIRPYVGDFLVVILLYCFIRSFLRLSKILTAIGVLLFSYVVEVLQYFNIVTLLGLQHCTLARIILGTSFEWLDILAYTLGIGVVIFCELKM